ncbi:cytochrome c554 family protein [Candidatus Poribacteria bacterium]|nr:cytochrome c554 family protein [Candidatus Poribacteria bacterium]
MQINKILLILFLLLHGKTCFAYLKLKETENHKTSKKNVQSEFKQVSIDQFVKPEVCAKCHEEIFNQWKGSMHSKAFLDPVWQAATKIFNYELIDESAIMEMKSCVKCHTPLGFRSYSIFSPLDNYSELKELPAQGIFCNWCHNIYEIKHIGNASYEVNPKKDEDTTSTMLGPFKDSVTDFHPSKYSELHTKSEFCGLCHNHTHAGNNLPIEQTYDEWEKSPYNSGDPETTVTCQDCHMRQRPGVPITGKTKMPDNPGKAAKDGPDRKHVWTHYFVGANSVVPKLIGSEVHAQMAIERLLNAADLKIIKDDAYKIDSIARIKIKVTNSGAGHYLPTGLTHIRQMWLDIKIKDKNGKLVYTSGDLDKNGEIDKEAVVYCTKFGDSTGMQIINTALADRVLEDHRIPPKGYVIEQYYFYIARDVTPPLEVEAALKYRSISQSLIKKLLKDKAPIIQIIDMVHEKDKIEFN